MADNYLEKQYDEYLARKSKEEALRRLQFKKRLKAYQEKLAREKAEKPE